MKLMRIGQWKKAEEATVLARQGDPPELTPGPEAIAGSKPNLDA